MTLAKPTKQNTGELGEEYQKRVDAIRSIDLREYIARESNIEPTHKGAAYYLFHSPFREDRNPSFAVYENRYYDFSTGEYGDIFEYVMKKLGYSNMAGQNFANILNYIDNQQTSSVEQHYLRNRPKKNPRKAEFSMETVWRSVADRHYASWYLEERGISQTVAEALHIGFYKYPITRPVDDKDITFHFDAVSFPNVYQGNVRNFKMRIITKGIWMQWIFDQDQNKLDKVRSYLDYKYPKYSTFDMVTQEAMVYQYLLDDRKYIHLAGGESKLYGHQCLYDEIDGEIRPKKWTYVFWVETELDCAMLQSLGFPAVSQYNGKVNLNPIRHSAKKFIIINDNDEAGRKYIARIKNVYPEADAIRLPDNYKDIGDLYKDQKADGIHRLIYDQLKYRPQEIYPNVN